MAKAIVEMPIQEVFDRLSIALIKREKLNIANLDEIDYYIKGIALRMNWGYYLTRLKNANEVMWDLEAKLGDESLSLEDKGRVALLIRKYNGERIKIKNEIVDAYGEGFKEIKKYHASAEHLDKKL